MLSQTYPCLEVETVSIFIPLCYKILLSLLGGGGSSKSFGERCRRIRRRRGVVDEKRRFKDCLGVFWGFLESRSLLDMDFNFILLAFNPNDTARTAALYIVARIYTMMMIDPARNGMPEFG